MPDAATVTLLPDSFSRFVFPRPNAPADAAVSLIGVTRVAIDVVLSEFMTALAMRLQSQFSGRGIATQCVLLVSDGFEVCWVDTRGITAEMVNNKAIRDRPISKFVRYAVRQLMFLAPNRRPDVAIAGGESIACPQPTVGRRIDVLPEALGRRDSLILAGHGSATSHVVPGAVFAAPRFSYVQANFTIGRRP